MKGILKIFGLAQTSRSLPLAASTGQIGSGHWQEDYLLGASETDTRWYYERPRSRDRG